MIEFYPPNSFIHKQAKTMEEFMINLIRNEGVFDLFLNDDEKKENEKLKRRDSKDNPDEIKIPKKRGRKPKNFIETERLKEMEKKMSQTNSNLIDLGSEGFISEKKYFNNIFKYQNSDFHDRKNIFTNEFDDEVLVNKQLNSEFNSKIEEDKDNNEKNHKNLKEADICVEI